MQAPLRPGVNSGDSSGTVGDSQSGFLRLVPPKKWERVRENHHDSARLLDDVEAHRRPVRLLNGIAATGQRSGVQEWAPQPYCHIDNMPVISGRFAATATRTLRPSDPASGKRAAVAADAFRRPLP